MPRRRQRFSDLEKQFRDSGGIASPGSRLAGYIEFKAGRSSIDVTAVLTAAQRKRVGYALLPFGLAVPATPAATDRYEAPITAYSNAIRTDLGLSNNECGYDVTTAATERGDSYYPALIRCFVPSGVNTTPISGVTGKEYNRKGGKSAGIPFGRTLTDVISLTTGVAPTGLDQVDQEDVKASLASKAKLSTGTSRASSVSFVPEEFKPGSSVLPAGA